LGISEKTVENQYGKAMKMLKLNLKHFTWRDRYPLIVIS
jgi:hypothetical protein